MDAMLRRLTFMATVFSIALVAVSCGRATEDQINQALGITPTATLSAEQIALSTAAAGATSTARALAASSPGAAAQGDVTLGKRQFDTWCVACHGPGGSGPDLLAAGGPGASVTPDLLLPIIREGAGEHPPGVYKTTEITDKQVADVAAYIQSSAGG
jgi:mono/diheme cytochrome c family protein